MAYAVVRTDKMFGTDNRAGMVSVRYTADGEYAEVENGGVLVTNGLETGSREVYVGETPTSSADIKDIVLIASPEVIYDNTKWNLDEFTNEAGTIARGYRLHTNDIFSVTKEAFVDAAEPEIGYAVEVGDTPKLATASSATGATLIGTVIDINVVGRYTYYAIQVA